MKSYSANITKKQIFYLSIPVFFSNIATPLVGIVDTGLMGNMSDAKFLAATSIATSVMTMIIWSFGFLRMGTVGMISQLYGKSDYREITKTLLRNYFIALVAAFLIIFSKNIILSLIEEFFLITKDTYKLIEIYVSVRIFSAPAELLIYILIGFFLGIQKTKISSLLIIMFSSLNIIISSFLVLTMDLNIFGVALGTLLASYITAIIFIFYTYRYIVKEFQVIPNLSKLFIPTKIIKLLNINVNIFIRTLFLTFSFLWINYLGAKLGEDFLAVNAILLQFVILASFFLDAYAFSTEGIVGFAIGRKNKKSFLLAVSNSLQLSFFTSIIISLLYLFFFKILVNLLTDVELLRYITYKYLIWIIFIPPIASLSYQLDGIFIGASQTQELRNAMIISVVSFIVSSIYLTKYFDNHGLWLSIIIFMILRSLTLNFYFNRILKKF